MKFSIIIPTLNEEASLRFTLDSLQAFAEDIEIIVVDGGSDDATTAIAQNYRVKILHAPAGRGKQLQRGANGAQGEVLWFLHADTIAAPECLRQITDALKNPHIVGGNFTLRFDGNSGAAKFLTWLYPKLRSLGLVYGDSAIFTRRESYEKIGGFRDYPIFEDLDFVGRLKSQGAIVALPAAVTTSSRRITGKSFLLTFLHWTILQFLYWLGVHPTSLLKIYFPLLKSKTD